MTSKRAESAFIIRLFHIESHGTAAVLSVPAECPSLHRQTASSRFACATVDNIVTLIAPTTIFLFAADAWSIGYIALSGGFCHLNTNILCLCVELERGGVNFAKFILNDLHIIVARARIAYLLVAMWAFLGSHSYRIGIDILHCRDHWIFAFSSLNFPCATQHVWAYTKIVLRILSEHWYWLLHFGSFHRPFFYRGSSGHMCSLSALMPWRHAADSLNLVTLTIYLRKSKKNYHNNSNVACVCVL